MLLQLQQLLHTDSGMVSLISPYCRIHSLPDHILLTVSVLQGSRHRLGIYINLRFIDGKLKQFMFLTLKHRICRDHPPGSAAIGLQILLACCPIQNKL